MNQRGLGLLLLGIIVGASFALSPRLTAPRITGDSLPTTGAVTIAAAGDVVIDRPLDRAEKDVAFNAIVDLVHGATVGLGNLDMNLLDAERAAEVRTSRAPLRTFGSTAEAAEIASIGFDILGLANNHATDFGADGLADTTAILKSIGVVPAGAGRDLGDARTPVIVERGSTRIAVIAVAISASPESMATATRDMIKGRPGVNPLRYVADVTVDAETYATLRGSAPTLLGSGGNTTDDRVVLQGATIRKGTDTSVTLTPDASDVEAVLAQVAQARATADVVVLSVHSHEPSNDSDAPAELFTRLGRQAIDAGAHLVVGHGPHRLRGVERYKHGVIVYSLSNFLYRAATGSAATADAYDAGADMYSLAMGISRAPAAVPGSDDQAWWEGAVAVATFDGAALRSLRLHPVDLGWELASGRRGVPRKPSPERARIILDRLTRLSQPYGTTIRVEDGVGVVDVRP